jgi:hypothetical protein
MSLDELVAAADQIVVATVVSTQASWDADHRRIHSTIALDVNEAWKGGATVRQRLTLVQPGGTVGDIEMTVIGMPRFSTGERSLLFLAGRERAQVVGMDQGKRALHWDERHKCWMAVSPRSDALAPAPDLTRPSPKVMRARAAAGLASVSQDTPLTELRRRVQSLMAGK